MERQITSLTALLAAYVLGTSPAHADIGDAIRAPVGGQVQVIAGQRIAQQGTSSQINVTGKVKDEIMYGGITFSYNTATNIHSLEGRVTPAAALGKGWFVGEETVVSYDVNCPVKITTGPVLRYAAGASHFTLVPAYQMTATADGVQHAFVYSMRGRLGVPKTKPQ